MLIEDRSPEAVGVALEVGDDLVSGHEAVGVVARVLAAGQLQVPVGRHEAEAVPPVAPALPHPSALEHDVVDPACLELMARGQSGRAGADDDDRIRCRSTWPEYRQSAAALSGTCVPLHLFGQLGWVEQDDPVSLRPHGAGVAELSQRADHDLAHRADGVGQILLRDPNRELAVRIAAVA